MTSTSPLHFRGSQAERTIAVARAVLAVSSLFAIWLDPAEPTRYAGLTYSLHSAYVTYALILLALVWRGRVPARLPIVTHVSDIVAFSIFQYLTLGPSSPFFVYFIFSLFCGAVRWGWRGTLATAAVVLTAFVTMGASMSRTLGATEFELNRFLIRIVYLAMVAWLLVYVGRHESRLRDEIQRLAHWPATTGGDFAAVVSTLLGHAASIVGAPRAVLAWEAGDEPWMYVAAWGDGPGELTRHAPDVFGPLISGPDPDIAFASAGEASVVHPAFRPRIGGDGLASAAFRSDRASGRAFFCGLRERATADVVPLVEVVVREMGASLGELLAQAHQQQIAIREERIRVARDLHDGVLQSMTGIRFELQALAREDDVVGPAVRDRLLALERALAIEQRELRLFIDDLKPLSQPAFPAGALGPHLEQLRRRLADEWKLPIALRTAGLDHRVPAVLEGAVPLMIHEALVNALKHAQPSKLTVDVRLDDGTLAISVCDDGRGFAFRGRYDHEMLRARNVGPVSLRERVETLGGRLTIDSGPAGSRVGIELPIRAEEAAWRPV